MTHTANTQPVVVLAGYRNDVRLAVVSADEADQLPLIVGPHERPMLPHGECSVMVAH